MTKSACFSVIAYSFGLICLMIGSSSCQKSDRANDNEIQSTQDVCLAYASWTDVFRQLDAVSSIQADVNRLVPQVSPLASCAVVTVNPALPNPSYPKLVTIDFGAGCTGPDGTFRSGQIIANFSGKYRDSLTTITIIPNNYYINHSKVSGTCVLTNMGIQSGHHWFTENVSNASILKTDGTSISWNSTLTRQWISGESTLNVVSDDIYLISGTGNGTGTKGNTFTFTINTPLRLDMSCHWIESGLLTLTPANLAPRKLDFGAGNCDNQATVSIFGVSYPIVLD
jgi:hypothetical protein